VVSEKTGRNFSITPFGHRADRVNNIQSQYLVLEDFMNYRIWFLGITILAVILFFLQSVFIVKHRDIIPEHDPTEYYSYVRSAVIDNDLNLKNENEHFGFNNYDISPIGLPINKYPIGFPLLVLPFYAATHGVITVFDHFGFNLGHSGYGIPYQLSFCLGSIFYGFLGLNLCYSFLTNYFARKISAVSLVVITFTTNLFYYFAAEPFMSHLCSFFSVSLFFYLWCRTITRENLSSYFWLGIAAALMISVRQQNIVFLVVALTGYWWNRVPLNRAGLSKALTLGVSGLVLGMLPQLLAWKAIFGSWIVYSYGDQSFIYKLNPKIFQVLFSSRHGLLSWHPIILLCLIGVLLSIRKYPRIAILFFAAFLLQLYINSSWWCWWLGNSFGHRGFVGCALIFAFGLAYILSEKIVNIASYKFIVSISALSIWNMLLAGAYISKMIPQTEYFTWTDLFTNIWRLPLHILYRVNNF